MVEIINMSVTKDGAMSVDIDPIRLPLTNNTGPKVASSGARGQVEL